MSVKLLCDFDKRALQVKLIRMLPAYVMIKSYSTKMCNLKYACHLIKKIKKERKEIYCAHTDLKASRRARKLTMNKALIWPDKVSLLVMHTVASSNASYHFEPQHGTLTRPPLLQSQPE